MEKQFQIGELKTAEDFEINSLIMEQASDIAESFTELECKKLDIQCWIEEDNEMSFTEEAQEIFNVYYDKYCDDLYNLLNTQLKVIK